MGKKLSFSTEKRELRSLDDLDLEGLPRFGKWVSNNPQVTGFEYDSRKIKPRSIFFGISGSNGHGCNYISEAFKRGASVVITDIQGKKIVNGVDPNLPLLLSENPRLTLANYCARWHKKQPKNQIAVTGTNGKTSVCHFVRQIWENLDLRSVTVGTLGVQGILELDLKNTTPDPIFLHDLLKRLSDDRVNHVAMEASSHGLDQHRLDAVELKGAAFTNLSRDHLDYHSSREEYLLSKSRLFTSVLKKDKFVVVNLDDKFGSHIKSISEECGHRVFTVGKNKMSDFRIEKQRFESDGQSLRFTHRDKSWMVYLPLIGEFQANNALMAAALVIGLGSSSDQVIETLNNLRNVPGRMELVANKKPNGRIFVDYAHTPEALRSALVSLRHHTMGRLILVIGAGGERDHGKRAIMGCVAKKYADRVFVTDDNPRNEIPSKIRRQIMEECSGAQEVPDRASAILTAIEGMASGDVVLIAGKGHETVQIIGDDSIPFNDGEFASMSVSILEGKQA